MLKFMRRRSGYVLLAVAVLLICFGLLVIAQREPRYQGRTLTSWLLQATTNQNVEAIQAVRQIGPRAVPELLDWIERPTPLMHEHLRALQQLVPATSLQRRTIPNRVDLAVFGFHVLGSRAIAAVPELNRLMKDRSVSQQTREAAMTALSNLGVAGLNPLVNAFADPSQPTRRLAAFYIGCMGYLGTNAAPAVPVLIGLLKDEEEQIAGHAAVALGDLKIEPELAVPALANALKDPRPFVRASAVSALARFGERARPAIPALTEALADPKLQVRTAASNALPQIAPPK